MKRLWFVFLLLFALIPVDGIAVQNPEPGTYEFRNGQWFDGKGFSEKTFYSVAGILTTRRPERVSRVVDLTGKYLVPPFGEAHNHNLGGAQGLEAQIAMYLREGVFYSKNLHYVRDFTAPVLDRVNRPSSVDVAYAHAGLVASGGHAVELYERLFERGVFRGWKKENLDTRAFFIMDSQEEVEKKWPQILAAKPDFIKTYLEYSEEYEKRKNDPRYYGQRGLHPHILKLIVSKAHQAGLRVSTHIETAADFQAAVRADVDEIAHLPGYKIAVGEDLSKYQIADADARLAARKGIVVVTTTVLSKSLYHNDAAQLIVVQSNQLRNLALLKKHNVKLAVGSDTISATSLAEAMNLYSLKCFDNLTLLKMWCEQTAKTIFPKRHIGFLRNGYEASFLALEGNPLIDFMNVKRVALRFKQGEMINLQASATPR